MKDEGGRMKGEGAASALLAELPLSGPTDVLWLAGEHSGDQHAALVAAELRELQPDWQQVAIGGPALKAAGIPLLHDLTESSVVGLVEVIRHYGYFKRLFDEVVEWIRRHQVKVLVLVDYPGFNLRLAEALHKAGLSRKAGGPVAIYYYISPQIWAWKGHRRFKMARFLDELGVIFPFEVDTFADTDLPVHFVGHPFLEPSHHSAVSFHPEGDLLLLAGSRMQAVRRILPVILEGVKRAMAEGFLSPEIKLSTLVPNDTVRSVVEPLIAHSGLKVGIHPFGTPMAARAVLTSSGTMSLACALAGIPGAIVYRAHPFTYAIGRKLVKIPYLGIANLILGRPMYPEYIQGAARPVRLADELERCLSPERQAQTQEDAATLRTQLSASCSERPASRIAHLALPQA